MITEMDAKPETLRETWSVAVCRDEKGTEFFDIDTLAGNTREARRRTRDEQKKLPAWYLANPIVRIAEVEIVESE